MFDKRLAAPLAAVSVIALVVGALIGGNLFTFITGEVGGLGPGFFQRMNVRVDTETVINTHTPENYLMGWETTLPRFSLWVWQLTGRMWVESDGSWSIYWSRHAGVVTTIGLNWIEDQMGDSPSTDAAEWISLSTSASAPSAAWTQIPSEIASNGLERAASSYASTGNGQWTQSHQFTASGTHTSVQLTGLQYANTGDNNLLCSDTFTPVTLSSGDKITVTWTVTVT